MYSKIVFSIPLVSLIFLLQTLFLKPLKKVVRIPLLTFAGVIFLFDLLIALYFYTSCYEMAVKYGYKTCLSWIYPTLDFKVMVVVSVFLLTMSLWALVHGWQRRAFYLIGALVVYLGVVFRVLIFLQSIQIINNSGSMNSAIIFEFFTIIVVYGLVSAFIYSGISFMGFFRRYTYTAEED